MQNRERLVAQKHFAAGRWAEAERAGSDWLRQYPDDLVVLELVSMAQCYQGKWQDAIALCRHYLALNPDAADVHNNLAVALKEVGQWGEAILHFQRAIALRPDAAGVYSNLGNLLQVEGRWDEAIATYQQAIALKPEFADAYDGLASVLQLQGKFPEAIVHHSNAIAHAPRNARLYFNLGNTHRLMGQWDAAIAAYDQALEHQPIYAEAYGNLGLVFQQQGNLDRAFACYQRAAELRPNYPENQNNLASIYRVRGELEEAVTRYERAIALRPDYAEAHNNLGLCRYGLGQFAAAKASYQTAIQLKPDYAEAHFNLGLLLLLLGDLAAGFQGYEWRWRQPYYRPRSLPKPLWDGSDLRNKTILLHAEQGLGDTIQFIRYVPLVVRQGGRVVVECQESLIPLLANLPAISQVISQGQPLPAFDVHLPLLSLPRLFNTTLPTIPGAIPYLRAQPDESFVTDASTLNVGIAWAGNPDNPNDRRRSTALREWLPILHVPNVRFYSLQKGPKSAEWELWEGDDRGVDWSDRLTHFGDTAAAIAALDLIITVDTAIAHLAGAMGKPVWVLLAYVPDWRWLLHRLDSPWYPTAQLFRQSVRNQWQEVMAEVADTLTWGTVHRDQLASPLRHPAQPGLSDADEPASATTSTVLTLSEALSRIRTYYRQRDFSQARELCDRVLHARPQQPIALNLLGLVEEELGHYEAAIRCYERAIAAKADFAEAHNNIGNALQRSGQYADSIPWYERAIALNPDYAQAYSNMGAALQELGRFDASIAAYRQALQLKPDYPEAFYNMGNAYRNQGDFAAALEAYRQAIALRPHHAEAYNNTGLTLFDWGRAEDAIAAYRQAIALRSDYADAHLNLALSLLVLGDFQTGFREYEWRWRLQTKGFRPPRNCPQPVWDGTPLQGKTILLHAEQGFGDTIQFIRYAPLVAEQGGRVIVEVQAPLKQLVEGVAGIAQAIAVGEPVPPFDVHAPLLSLPYLLGTTPATIPASIPYLFADATRLPLPALPAVPVPRLKVGIVWAGSPTHRSDRYRSCRLDDLMPLFQVRDVAFYSLQKGPQVEAALHPRLVPLPVVDLSDRLHDFSDTAAAIAQLDLVITVDTSVGHLAAALGKPVWILLSYAPDWRWLLHRSDSPWYPTVRLFRQARFHHWGDVIAEVCSTLPTFTPPSAPVSHAVNRAASSPLRTSTAIGIGFPIGVETGWSVYGLNLSLQLLRRSDVTPVPLMPIANPARLNPIHRTLLLPLMEHQQRLQAQLKQTPDHPITTDWVMLRGLGNQFVMAEDHRRLVGRRNVGVIFSEDTHFTPAAIAIGHQFDRIIAGSTWNATVLQRYGLTQVRTVMQGIDPTLFHPAPKSGVLGDRFVIFSGGKLEYRKGQDLVVAAFRAFHSRHPDAVLMTAWHNLWPRTMVGIDRAGHVQGLPSIREGRMWVTEWLAQNGVPPTAIIDIGLIPNHLAGAIVREADVAVFPNRAEGGTNLVAMECLACGVPTILSANTGHLDLMGDHVFALRQQAPVTSMELYQGTADWGESDVDEMVETLEWIYYHREAAQERGQVAARWMQNWTWEHQCDRFLSAIDVL